MAGFGSVKQTKRNSKVHPKLFKKVFSFKQLVQCPPSSHICSHPETTTVSSIAEDAPDNDKRYTKPYNAGIYEGPSSDESSCDDDTSTCSSTTDTTEGVLIFVTAHRLTESSPPPTAILDRIPGAEIKQHKSLPSLGRRKNSSLGALPLSPYQSKKEQRNLSATLKICRNSKPDGKFSSLNNSAWERRQPTSTTSASRRSMSISLSRSRGSALSKTPEERCQPFTGTIDAGFNNLRTASSDSVYLPPEISPANKFVPIGCEEDDDDCSFDSEDYDICQVSMGGDADQPAAATATIIVTSTSHAHVPAKKSCTQEEDDTRSKVIDQSVQTTTVVVNKSLSTDVTSKSCVNKNIISPKNVANKDKHPSTSTKSGKSYVDKKSKASKMSKKNKHLHQSTESQGDGNHKSEAKYSQSSIYSCVGASKPSTLFHQDNDYFPPSPGSTAATACTSRESNELRVSPLRRRKRDSKFDIDRIFVCMECQDQEEDWFPNVKEEIMKLSSVFASNCGASGTDIS